MLHEVLVKVCLRDHANIGTCIPLGKSNNDKPRMRCLWGGRSLLIRAIDDVELLPDQRKYHIANKVANVRPSNAFRKEKNGRLPVLEAAQRRLIIVVGCLLDTAAVALYSLTDQADVVYRQFWPKFTAAAQEPLRAQGMRELMIENEQI